MSAQTGAAWLSPLRNHHSPAPPGGLVLDLPPELSERGIRHMAGKTPVTDHPGDVQVLDHQRPEPAGQVAGGLMQRIPALVSDPALSLPQRRCCAAPPVRRLLPGPPIRPPPP